MFFWFLLTDAMETSAIPDHICHPQCIQHSPHFGVRLKIKLQDVIALTHRLTRWQSFHVHMLLARATAATNIIAFNLATSNRTTQEIPAHTDTAWSKLTTPKGERLWLPNARQPILHSPRHFQSLSAPRELLGRLRTRTQANPRRKASMIPASVFSTSPRKSPHSRYPSRQRHRAILLQHQLRNPLDGRKPQFRKLTSSLRFQSSWAKKFCLIFPGLKSVAHADAVSSSTVLSSRLRDNMPPFASLSTKID